MISYSNKSSYLYSELDYEKQLRLFDFTKSKFLHNIDSFYYSIRVDSNFTYCDRAKKFKMYLESYRKKSYEKVSNVVMFQESEFQENVNFPCSTTFQCAGIGTKVYPYDFHVTDKYFVFIVAGQPNDLTPQVHVQIRSQWLWLVGEHRALKESLAEIEKILHHFEMNIVDVRENRIDYAYHTNYIQDPINFFKEENLNAMAVQRMPRYSLEGTLVGEWGVERDYMTFGRKKSNNLFIRCYDKTKEVVQMGYKQFFLQIWKMEGLISYFDFYCYEKAFLVKNWNYVDIARLEFYLRYGENEDYKNQIRSLLGAKNYDYEEIIKLADFLVGKVTKILNFEIETKRKFYYSFEKSISSLPLRTVNVPDYARNIYRVIDNKQSFHDYITLRNDDGKGIIRFINLKAKNKDGVLLRKFPSIRKKDYPTADWWRRLQSCDMKNKYDDDSIYMFREYQKNVDFMMMKKKHINQLANISVVMNFNKYSKYFEKKEKSIYKILKQEEFKQSREITEIKTSGLILGNKKTLQGNFKLTQEQLEKIKIPKYFNEKDVYEIDTMSMFFKDVEDFTKLVNENDLENMLKVKEKKYIQLKSRMGKIQDEDILK